MSTPIGPEPVRDYRPEYIPAYLGNGVIGMRVGRIPFVEGTCIVNGLAAVHPVDQIEGFAQAPYPLGGDVEINGLQLSALTDHVHFVEQRYDFSCGELTTRLDYVVAGVRAQIEIVVFCSRTQPTVVCHEVRVTVDRECDLTLVGGIEHSGIPGTLLGRETRTPGSDKPVVDGAMLWETNGALSTCGAAYVTTCEGEGLTRRRVDEDDTRGPLRTSYTFDARPGATYVLRQLTSLVPSQSHSEPHREATRLAAVAAAIGFADLRSENRAAWSDIWKGRIRIAGDRRWQELADAALYYLHASAHASSVFSTSMFGLAYWPNYHYYRGQVMWDIETFAFPPLLLTDPHAADSLLQYRTAHLEGALRNAALNGYRGLQFPWASGPRDGQEMIRTSAPLVTLEQHVSLSVALAFAQYAHVTGDDDFLSERAWPILEGVAKWISSRVTPGDRGYEIRRTIGIAEKRDRPIDNCSYVNLGAILVLREAVAAARRLQRGTGDAQEWERIASGMAIPKDGDVILNHDHYREEEQEGTVDLVTRATPETLAAFFPLGYRATPEIERATIEHYLSRVEPFIGHPMLSAPLGVYAAWTGDRARSRELFERGYAEFINEPFTETDEFSRRFGDKPRVGPFMGNTGGFLSACLLGFPGVRIGCGDPSTWPERRVVLPEGWDAIEAERLWIRGRPATLTARHGDERARLTMDEGTPARAA